MPSVWLRQRAHNAITECKAEFAENLNPADTVNYVKGLHTAFINLENKYNTTFDRDRDPGNVSFNELNTLTADLKKQMETVRKVTNWDCECS